MAYVDLPSFAGVPTLIIHGTGDKTVPIDPSARAAARGFGHAKLIEYDGEPHGPLATAPDRLNGDLLEFLRGDAEHSPRGPIDRQTELT